MTRLSESTVKAISHAAQIRMVSISDYFLLPSTMLIQLIERLMGNSSMYCKLVG